MAESITNTGFAFGLEQVKSDIANYSSYQNKALSMIGPAKVAEASRWGYRTPFLRWRGGAYSKVSLDRGAHPNGTGPLADYFVSGFFPSELAIELTQEQISLSQSSTASRVDVLKDVLANILEVLNAHDNIHFLGDGSGILTNSSSAKPSTTQLQFAATTDNIGVNQLLKGMSVDIWDSTASTKRANGPYTIKSIDTKTGYVTFTSAPTGLTSGDLLTVANVDTFGPAAPTTNSSTYPSFSTAAGVVGDSWRHGTKYVIDNTDAYYYLGKLKSSFPELKATVISAGGFKLNWEMVELAKNQMIQARDESLLNGLMGIMHMCQVDVLKETLVRIARWDLSAKEGRYTDLPPQVNYQEVFNVDGIPCFQEKAQDRSLIQFLNKSNWGKVQCGEGVEYVSDPNMAQGSIPLYMVLNSSGQYLNAWQTWARQTFDWVCHDPGANMAITGLAVKAGYAPA